MEGASAQVLTVPGESTFASYRSRSRAAWRRLRRCPSAIAGGAIVIVLVLTRPAPFFSSPIGGDTVIILQASASMQATDVAPSRFEAARSRIADLLDGIGPGGQGHVVQLGQQHNLLRELERPIHIELFHRSTVVQQRQKLNCGGAEIDFSGLHVRFVLDALQLQPVEIDAGDVAGTKPVVAHREHSVVVCQVIPGESQHGLRL